MSIEIKLDKIVIDDKDGKKEINKIFQDVGKEIAQEAKNLIKNSQGTGITKKVKGITHTASAPGQPPADLTGNLAKDFGIKVRNGTLTVTADSYFALPLEKGAKNGNWILAPRPFMETAFDKVSPDLSKRIGDAWFNGVKLKK